MSARPLTSLRKEKQSIEKQIRKFEVVCILVFKAFGLVIPVKSSEWTNRNVKTFISCHRTPDPRSVAEGVSEGFLKGPRTCLAFKNPSKTFQEGVEIDDAFKKISSKVRGSCSRK